MCYLDVPVSKWLVTILYLSSIWVKYTFSIYIYYTVYIYGWFTTYELGCNPKYEAMKPGIPARSHTHLSSRACHQCVTGLKVGQRMHHTGQPVTRTQAACFFALAFAPSCTPFFVPFMVQFPCFNMDPKVVWIAVLNHSTQTLHPMMRPQVSALTLVPLTSSCSLSNLTVSCSNSQFWC